MTRLIAVIAGLMLSATAFALTTAQYQSLKSSILADPSLAAHVTAGNFAAIADAYNQPTASQCWRSGFSQAELLDVLNFTTFIGRSAGERDALVLMFSQGLVDARRANVRQGLVDIFSGGTGSTQRAALADAMKRACTRAEVLFATGPTDGAYITSHEGALGWPDVRSALLEH